LTVKGKFPKTTEPFPRKGKNRGWLPKKRDSAQYLGTLSMGETVT